MADGPTEPESDGGGRPEEGKILSPEELDIAESEHVEQLDEGRFVVSPGARADAADNSGSPESEPTPGPDEDGDPREKPRAEQEQHPSSTGERSRASTGERSPSTAGELTQEEAHRWLRESFEGMNSRYGFDVTATFDGSVSQRRMASNDVVTIFESLVLWYAQQVDSDTPVEEILGILLMEANAPIRYPPESLKKAVGSAGLGPEDTIADLLAAVERQDGLKL